MLLAATRMPLFQKNARVPCGETDHLVRPPLGPSLQKSCSRLGAALTFSETMLWTDSRCDFCAGKAEVVKLHVLLRFAPRNCRFHAANLSFGRREFATFTRRICHVEFVTLTARICHVHVRNALVASTSHTGTTNSKKRALTRN